MRVLLTVNVVLIAIFGVASGLYKLFGGAADLPIFAALGFSQTTTAAFGAVQAFAGAATVWPRTRRPAAWLLAGCNLIATAALFAAGIQPFGAISLIFVVMAAAVGLTSGGGAARRGRSRHIAAVLVVLNLTAAASANAQGTPPAQPPTLAAAQALLGSGDVAGARKALEAIVAAAPKNFAAWTALGGACQRLKDHACAVHAFEQAHEARPADLQTLVNLGIAFAAKGDTDAAFDWLQRARVTRRIDMTQLSGNPAMAALEKDPRYAALMPTADDFAQPFVEDVKIVHEFADGVPNAQFGWIARTIGDVDDDGVLDFVTSAPSHSGGGSNAGRIYVYSSKSGKLLWQADGKAGDSLGIGIEAAGDVNGDGKGDVIASAPTGGYAKVYDGRTGAVLLTLKAGLGVAESFGRHVSGSTDLNGDKIPDLIVGAPGGPPAAPSLPAPPADFSGRAYVFSGKDGQLLHTFAGERAGDGFGSAVSASMRDGQPMVVVGAPTAGPQHTGRAYFYRGLTAAPAFTRDADEQGGAFAAMFIAMPGDVNADGTDDVFVSDWAHRAKGPSTGRVYVFSGKDGAPLQMQTGETAGDGLGTSQSIAGDVDGDGTPDLIVGAWQYGGGAVSGGRAYLYSGKTGALLKTYTCRTPGDTFGFDAVGMGDVDGDGIVDLLITSGWSAVKGFHSGRVFIISSGVTRGTSAATAPTFAVAQAQLSAGQPALARTTIEALLAAAPDSVRGWNALNRVCMAPQIKDYACAVDALSHVLALRPDDPQALLGTGIAYAAQGNADAAFGFFSRARTTRRIDMTQLTVNPLVAPLAQDARFAALLPAPADFAEPFVEPTHVVHDFKGETAGDGFGWIARSIGDVDGDGASDFVTSAPSFGAGGTNMGRVYVYSSRSGQLLWTADGAPGDRLGVGVEAAGDINRDGAGDVAASSPTGGYARVYDGRTGRVLLTLKAGAPSDLFGRRATGIGDVNHDGWPDLLVGAPGGARSAGDYAGRAYVFSGKDGAELFVFSGDRGGDGFGAAIDGATVNGRTTIVIGASSGGPNRTGRATVFHGLTNVPSFVIDGDETDIALAAMFVGVPGDLDGDGVEDIYATDWVGAAKGPGTGRVYLHSGRTGELLYAITGENAGDNLGSTQATTGDVDGDGTPDLILGAWQYGGAAISGGRAYLYSGKTGTLLKTYTNRIPGDTFSFDGVGIGDVDGDGMIDLLITGGGSAINGYQSGRVFIISSGVARKAR